MLGSRTMNSGTAAATARTKNTNRPMARPSGGSATHNPSQEAARNRPAAVAIEANAGHSRSQRIDQRARDKARDSTLRPCSGRSLALSGAVWVNKVSGPENPV